MYWILNGRQFSLHKSAVDDNTSKNSKMYINFVILFIAIFVLTIVLMFILDTQNASKSISDNNKTSGYLRSALTSDNISVNDGIVYANFIIPKTENAINNLVIDTHLQLPPTQDESQRVGNVNYSEQSHIQTTVTFNNNTTPINTRETSTGNNVNSISIDVSSNSDRNNTPGSYTNISSFSSTNNSSIYQQNNWSSSNSN